MTWHEATTLAQLAQGPVVFRSKPLQIAVFLHAEAVHAVDNRCPHEGYPLSEGAVSDDGILTCNWHNWKFQLVDGNCLLGGDHVRAYPTEVRGDEVWVEVVQPSLDEVRQTVRGGLRTAFDDRDYGRMGREIARLHYQGLDAREAVRWALDWAHDRLEYGTTHAQAATSDWLDEWQAHAGDPALQLVCLTEAVDHLAHDALRHPAYPYASPAAEPFTAEAFLEAIEAEQREVAEALVARALADGVGWDTLHEPFARAALAHYNDFGHSAIYVTKVSPLIAQLGAQVAPALLLPLTRSLAYSTREDLIPDFRDYAPALERMPPVDAPVDAQTDAVLDASELFGASVPEALDWVVGAAAGNDACAIYDALLEASARNLLHFDLAYQDHTDRPVSQSVGWLDFTHAVTLGYAVKEIATLLPDTWRPGLLQMACFVGRNRAYVDRDLDVSRWTVDDEPAFLTQVHGSILDHGFRDPIFSSHVLKTARAVEAELPGASDTCRATLLAALNRFLHSPFKEKHALRLARQAMALVGRDFSG